MARDTDDPRKRRRDREDEQESAESEKVHPGSGTQAKGSTDNDRLDSLLKQAEPLIDQLTNLYNQFVLGVELRPPLEKRKQIDVLMGTIQSMAKPTPALQFRANSVTARYVTNRDHWDRQIRDLESGKIKRIAGPVRGPIKKAS